MITSLYLGKDLRKVFINIQTYNHNIHGRVPYLTCTNIGVLISNSRLHSGSVRYRWTSTSTESPRYILKNEVGVLPSEYIHVLTTILLINLLFICCCKNILAYPSHIPGELDHLSYKVPMLSKGNLLAKQQEKYKHKKNCTKC